MNPSVGLPLVEANFGTERLESVDLLFLNCHKTAQTEQNNLLNSLGEKSSLICVHSRHTSLPSLLILKIRYLSFNYQSSLRKNFRSFLVHTPVATEVWLGNKSFELV